MPSIPKYTKCAHLGCKNTKTRLSSFCVEHGGRDGYTGNKYNNTKERQDFNSMYATKQWKVFRQVELSKNPLCAGCLSEGKVIAANHLDHVFPWAKIGKHAFYHNIFQSLCQSCHSSKTSLEQKGIFRQYGTPHKDWKLNEYGMAIWPAEADVSD